MSKFVISKGTKCSCPRVVNYCALGQDYIEVWRGKTWRKALRKKIVIKQFVQKGFNFGYFLIFYHKPKIYLPPLS